MSGEGILPAQPARHWLDEHHDDVVRRAWAAGREQERADTLAYLARRRANAERVARRSPDHAEHATTAIRECDIVSEYLRGGMHEGDATLGLDAAPTQGQN